MNNSLSVILKVELFFFRNTILKVINPACMKKIYNRNSNPTSNSDDFQMEEMIRRMQKKSKRQVRNDNLMLGLIFIVGVIGFYYVFFLDGKIHTTTVLTEDITPNIVATQIPTKEKKQLNYDNELHIIGNHEANEPIQFVLDSYNEEVIYTLRFGNGTGRVLKGKVTDYVYPNSGVYEVRLEARYKNEKIIMYNNYVSIDDAITVAEGALEEQI